MTGLLASIFVASLAGSLHCAAMCGALATASCATCRTIRGTLGAAASYHVARGAAYAGAGALAGGLGGAIDLGGALVGVQRLAAFVAGAMVILCGTLILLRWRGAAPCTTPALSIEGRPLAHRRGALGSARARVVERAAAAWRTLAMRAEVVSSPLPRAAAIGALSVLLPCGWLWAFLAVAAGTGSWSTGALAMTAFWAGSVPLLGAVSLGAGRLGSLLRGRAAALMGVAMIALGAHMAWTAAGRGTAIAAAVHTAALHDADAPARLRAAVGEVPACCREEAP